MFGIGGTEFLLILLFAFLIFGPDKLPAIGRTIGRAMRQFRNAQDEMNKVIQTEVYDPLKDTDPLKNPFDSSKGAKKKSNVSAATPDEETFAERKARMTREKEAARAAKEQASAHPGAAKSATESGAAASATAKETPTANDLYDTTTAKPSPAAKTAAKAASDKGSSTATQETFAERKARLNREKAAATGSTDAGKGGEKDA